MFFLHFTYFVFDRAKLILIPASTFVSTVSDIHIYPGYWEHLSKNIYINNLIIKCPFCHYNNIFIFYSGHFLYNFNQVFTYIFLSIFSNLYFLHKIYIILIIYIIFPYTSISYKMLLYIF